MKGKEVLDTWILVDYREICVFFPTDEPDAPSQGFGVSISAARVHDSGEGAK